MPDAPYLGPIHCEEHWLQSGDPEAMTSFLGERGSKRRWQLFACACCWRLLPLLVDESSRNALSIAERRAEGDLSEAEVREAEQEAVTTGLQMHQAQGFTPQVAAAMAAAHALLFPRRAFLNAARATGISEPTERVAQCRLLRDLFGNPFRPFVIDPTWLTPLVLSMAAQIYLRERFDELPVLGDALEDAGCRDEPLLHHCRSENTHVRGCWALDALLGRD